MFNRSMLILFAAVLLLVAAAGMVFAPRPTTAQEEIATFRTLLDQARADKSSITIQFADPLIAGERSWTLPENASGRTISLVGADFICFSEPWNNASKERCTPFSNLISVTYIR
jgi:hypothetical protein